LETKLSTNDVISPSKNKSFGTRANKQQSESVTNVVNTKICVASSPVEEHLPLNTNCSTRRKKINFKTTDSDHKTSENECSSTNNNSVSSKSQHLSTRAKPILNKKKVTSTPTSSRRNLRVRVNKNESDKKKRRVKVIITEATSTGSDSEMNSFGSIVRGSNKPTVLTKSKKNILSNSTKTKVTENTSKISHTETRFTRSSTQLTELQLPRLVKLNKSVSPNATKNGKFKKTNQTKKTKNIKSYKKIQPESIQTENVPNISSPLRTRSRKRAANTPLSEPKAKDPKCNISSKVANKISLISNSSHSSSDRKLTRNTTKLILAQVSDNSLPETLINKKINEKVKAKKRELNSEDSSDSAPSAKKITRRTAIKNKETKIEKSNSSIPTRSRSKIESSDTDEPVCSSFNEKTNENCIFAKPKRTRSTTISKTKIELLPAARVLRSREKKKIDVAKHIWITIC